MGKHPVKGFWFGILAFITSIILLAMCYVNKMVPRENSENRKFSIYSLKGSFIELLFTPYFMFKTAYMRVISGFRCILDCIVKEKKHSITSSQHLNSTASLQILEDKSNSNFKAETFGLKSEPKNTTSNQVKSSSYHDDQPFDKTEMS